MFVPIPFEFPIAPATISTVVTGYAAPLFVKGPGTTTCADAAKPNNTDKKRMNVFIELEL